MRGFVRATWVVVVGCGGPEASDTTFGPGGPGTAPAATDDGDDEGADDGSDTGATAGATDDGEDDAVDDTVGSDDEGSSGEPLPDPCEPIDGVSYGQLPTVGPPTDRPAAEHGDLNLHLRSWSPVGGELGLIMIDGPTDDLAPRLNAIFEPDRVPTISTNYAVNQWDWSCDCQGPPITDWEVTLAGFATAPGEVLQLPRSGYDIGMGYQARVLFASDESVTLKYTGEDDVVYGYTVHIDGLCVEPSLRALYDELDADGRAELPALNADQPLGRARGNEIQVAIRDTGMFMDPRSDKDWWD